jgi:uncharacterized protein YjbI with pentapeptide repeats
MKKVPTAEDFLQDHHQISHFYDDKTNNMVCFSDDVQKAMIEFAKLHLEAQKKAILKNAKLKKVNFWGGTEIDKNSILNSYPLDKIK